MNLQKLKTTFQDYKKQFSISEVSPLIKCVVEGCPEIPTSDRFHNTFFYEIAPLYSIAEHLGKVVTHIQFVGSHERFDGIFFLNNNRTQRVEITAAIDGHNDALQMELLKKRGHVPAFQKIEVTGTKKMREFGENVLVAQKPANIDSKILLPLLESAYLRKIEKGKKNPNYSGAWLAIVFDDHVQPNLKKKRQRFDPLCQAVLETYPLDHSPFSRLFFVGVSMGYVFDSDQVKSVL